MAKSISFNQIQESQIGKTPEQIAEQAQKLVQPVPVAPVPQMSTMKPLVQTTAIPVDTLIPQQPIDLTGTLPKPDPAQATATLESTKVVSNDLQKYLDKLETPKTELDDKDKAFREEISGLLGQNVGQTKMFQQEEDNRGVGKIKGQLTELNSEILMRTAALEKQIANENLDPNNSSNLAYGRVANLRASAAADISILGARAQALQGNLTLATGEAQRAVDLKFKPIEENITAKEKQLELIKPLLNKEQEKIANAQAMMLADEKEKIAETKARTKTNLEMAFTSGLTNRYINQNGRVFRASDGFDDWTPEEALADMGVSSWEEAYERGLIGDLTSNLLADRDFVLKAREKYPDALINIFDDAETAARKIQENSYIYGKETYMAPETADSGKLPDSVKIGDETYFYGDDGQLYPASDFVAGGVEGNTGNKYVSTSGGALEVTAGQADSLASFDTTKSAAESALQMLNQGVKAGPVTGRFLGPLKTLGVADPKQEALEQLLSSIKAEFQKAISGAAVSDQEVVRLSKFLPSITDQESTLRTKLQTLISESTRKKQGLLEVLGGKENPNFGGGSIGNGPPLDLGRAIKSGGLTFNSAGNASASGNRVLGTSVKAQPMQKLTNVVINKFPEGSYPTKTGAVSNECGYYARNVIKSMGLTYPPLGNGLTEKIKAIADHGVPAQQARIGSVVVTRENPTYGHVAVVLQKTPQGVYVTESNFKQSDKISHGRFIPYEKIVGAINPSRA